MGRRGKEREREREKRGGGERRIELNESIKQLRRLFWSSTLDFICVTKGAGGRYIVADCRVIVCYLVSKKCHSDDNRGVVYHFRHFKGRQRNNASHICGIQQSFIFPEFR